MTPDQVLEALHAASSERIRADAAAKAAEDREKELIADAWRAEAAPQAIADAARRSLAHVRKFRPADVPPRRTGGGYAAKNARKRSRPARTK